MVSRSTHFDDPELLVLMCISLSMATISVLAALCAFYWFVRMRRSFRHDLIMLLIQSDMMKALWLAICPLAFFAKLPIDSRSTFCQVSGFFLTASIEAADIAVLLIAIHTALFIVRLRTSNGIGGLYPYRWIAYAAWAVIPLILAAIVPITGGSFADNGPHCYLPVRPLWYRRALSWVPRYVIFGIIIVTYICVYIYVAFQFRRFDRDQRRASTQPGGEGRGPRRGRHVHRGDVPPTPPIADHGLLLDSTRDSLAKCGEMKDRQQSTASTISTLNIGEGETNLPRRPSQARKGSMRWNAVNFSQDKLLERPHLQHESQSFGIAPASPLFADEEAAEATTAAVSPIRPPGPVYQSSADSSQHSNPSQCKRSIPISAQHRSVPRPGVTATSTIASTATSFSSSVHLPRDATEAAMRRSREKQQRQLRLLFVYPMIYMLTWITPFVSHVLRYDDESAYDHVLSISPTPARSLMHQQPYATSPRQKAPLPLQAASIASLCIAAAVDCGFFTAWERPWQHLQAGFWASLAQRLRVHAPLAALGVLLGRGRRRAVGRTREEMFVDARTARTRRDREESFENYRYSNDAITVTPMPPRPRREWWDVLDVDLRDEREEEEQEEQEEQEKLRGKMRETGVP
ncbi:G protein-coupled receptor gpr1 [Parahypoxylon ruwenzoriense]